MEIKPPIRDLIRADHPAREGAASTASAGRWCESTGCPVTWPHQVWVHDARHPATGKTVVEIMREPCGVCDFGIPGSCSCPKPTIPSQAREDARGPVKPGDEPGRFCGCSDGPADTCAVVQPGWCGCPCHDTPAQVPTEGGEGYFDYGEVHGETETLKQESTLPPAEEAGAHGGRTCEAAERTIARQDAKIKGQAGEIGRQEHKVRSLKGTVVALVEERIALQVQAVEAGLDPRDAGIALEQAVKRLVPGYESRKQEWSERAYNKGYHKRDAELETLRADVARLTEMVNERGTNTAFYMNKFNAAERDLEAARGALREVQKWTRLADVGNLRSINKIVSKALAPPKPEGEKP